MNKLSQRNKKSAQGFTIIEVVLVLAIAALIFLMVFIALPALQRGQRDAGRKNDVSIVVSALQTYLSNNRGSFGTGTTVISGPTLQKYVDRLSQYQPTDISVTKDATSGKYSATKDTIKVYTGVTCDASMPAPGDLRMQLNKAGSRQAAVITALENSGTQEQVYCQEL